MQAESAALGWIIPPSRLEETPLLWELLPPHIWITDIFFFSCPCARVISINLQCNICESPLFLHICPPSPLYDLVSAHWAYTRQPSLSRLQMFLLLCGEEQVAAGQQVDHSFQKRNSLGKGHALFQSHERSQQVDATFTKNLNLYPETLLQRFFFWLLFFYPVIYCMIK